MKNMKRMVSLLLALVMMLALAACGGNQLEVATEPPVEAPVVQETTPVEEAKDPLAFEAGTVLRMATGYNSAKTGLFFDADTAGEGITLADGKTYWVGEYQEVWYQGKKVDIGYGAPTGGYGAPAGYGMPESSGFAEIDDQDGDLPF